MDGKDMGRMESVRGKMIGKPGAGCTVPGFLRLMECKVRVKMFGKNGGKIRNTRTWKYGKKNKWMF
jgi:hypothetical protein